jgi:ubiquinone/menaquinone biosynthesis C-methylase UbiE
MESQYKKTIADYFSTRNHFWNDLYLESKKNINQFVKVHMNDRKRTVIQLLDKYSKNRKMNILEVGCGTGNLMEEVTKRGHSVVGLDISKQMIIDAKSRMENSNNDILCTQGDVEKLPFKSEKFDLVLGIGVLEYLYDENKGLTEINRILKNDGIIIVSLPNLFKIQNIFDPYYYFGRGFEFLITRKLKFRKRANTNLKQIDFSTNDQFTNRRYLKGKIDPLFNKYNFHHLEIISLGFGPFTFWRRSIFSNKFSLRISKILENISRTNFFSFLSTLSNRWVVCKQKHVT